MKKLQLLLLLFVLQINAQQGGMWIPSLLKGINESEMKNLGMKISAEDIYAVNKSSIKDAVPQFDNKCSAEVISSKGLILTNHHCGFDAIQDHSSVEHDYITNGYWAYKMEDELLNKDMVVTFVVRIEDVTTKILNGTELVSTEIEKQKKIQENSRLLIRTSSKESWQENTIKTFYNGNQYLLFVTETFKDIRLVGAPPSAIGKFGDVTDNWVWPRHTGDFSLFRIYADKNNKPATYSKENIPYTPKHFFQISLDGIKENDFTLVLGYPGLTQEYLPSYAVEQIVNSTNPIKIEIRDAVLKTQDMFMRKDNAIKIQYAAKNASIANAWKKWSGEIKGLRKVNAIGAKQEFEKQFQEKVIKAGKQTEYGNLLPEFKNNYQEIKDYAIARDIYNETVRHVEILTVGYKLYLLEQVYITKGEESFNDRRMALINGLGAFYKNFNPEVDQESFEKLIAIYSTKYPEQFLPNYLENIEGENLAKKVFEKSQLVNYDKIKNLLTGDTQTVIEKLKNDIGFQIIKLIADAHFKNVAPKYDEINLKISATQRTYMKAILELFPKGRIFPDANSTLRVTYGKVKGYKPNDGVIYEPFTYLDGVMEKYIPNDYEFDVPEKLINLYNTKDYGAYGVKGRMPLNFIATNHTTGGNSGSPALDAKGNLIGLNFDRVWEGTMSDIYYSPEICRNIMVDIRYVLFVIDKFADAKNIIDELELIHHKNKK